jgi:hypothetical protein
VKKQLDFRPQDIKSLGSRGSQMITVEYKNHPHKMTSYAPFLDIGSMLTGTIMDQYISEPATIPPSTPSTPQAAQLIQ